MGDFIGKIKHRLVLKEITRIVYQNVTVFFRIWFKKGRFDPKSIVVGMRGRQLSTQVHHLPRKKSINK